MVKTVKIVVSLATYSRKNLKMFTGHKVCITSKRQFAIDLFYQGPKMYSPIYGKHDDEIFISYVVSFVSCNHFC